jgi:chloramphenicol-sensitive protein RarD
MALSAKEATHVHLLLRHGENSMNPGIVAAIGAYASWGMLPIYWKLLGHVPTSQLLCHRITWSFVVLAIFLVLTRRIARLRSSLSPSVWGSYVLASLLIGVNWFIYVWSVNAGYIVEASLGYFINPLLSVLLGVFFMRERLRPLQWAPLGLAAAGVIYLTFDYGRLPWIALSLASTFSLYGLVKKKAPLGAFEGLTLETGLLLAPALAWLGWSELAGTGAFLHAEGGSDLLLMGAGVVTTAPLVMFAAAAHRIPLSMIGILQYIAPTIQFLIGVFMYHEPFSRTQFTGFGMVWLAVLLFWLERWSFGRKLRHPA